MKISINKKEYRLLLDMLYLSDWMLNSYKEGVEEKEAPYKLLRKKLLSYYKEMGAEDIVEYSKEFDDYFEVRKYDETIHDRFIDPYEANVFWDELIHQLAKRDVINAVGGRASYHAMELEERISKVSAAEEHYANEFEIHGLDYLKVNHAELTAN